MTTTYDTRDIRAADLLAIVLFGFGCVLAAMAGLLACVADVAALVERRHGSSTIVLAMLAIAAVAFLLTGGVLNRKVRQLVRNGGREPADCGRVPD